MSSGIRHRAINRQEQDTGGGGGSSFGALPSPVDYFGSLKDDRKLQWKNFISGLEDDCSDESTGETSIGSSVGRVMAPQTTKPSAGLGASAGRLFATTAAGSTNTCNNDRGEPSFPSINTHHSLMNSMYMQQLHSRGGFHLGGADIMSEKVAGAAGAATKSSSTGAIPSSLSLRDWIAYYASNQNPFSSMSTRIDKGYLEKATRVALSLAKRLHECYGKVSSNSLQDKDIIVGKIVVTNTDTCEIDFVNISPSPTSFGNIPSTAPQCQRSAISFLGRVFYEMFTQGTSCPLSTIDDSKSDAEDQFALALKIAGSSENEDGYESEGERRRKQPRRISEESAELTKHYEALQLEGLPPSICQLVADMLGNENADGSLGGLFRPDHLVGSFSDVISDLQQMVDEPNSFLHNSLLMRLAPVIPDKLYGRNDELQQCLEIANAVCKRKYSSAIGLEHSQSVIMISGHSGCGKSRVSLISYLVLVILIYKGALILCSLFCCAQ